MASAGCGEGTPAADTTGSASSDSSAGETTGSATSTGETVSSSTGAPEGSSSSSTGEPIVFDGEPIDVPADGAWHFVEVEGMACNGGVQGGVGVRRVEGATRLVLYFKGGGACFNPVTCGFTSPLMQTGPEAMQANPDGVLDFANEDNPLLDANIVYMPYCTGDVHAGVLGEQNVPDVDEPWNFVGHDNVLAALDRLVPTFSDPEQLVVLGTSAGGLGALFNFRFIRAGWPSTDTVMIDDSGVILPDAFLNPCLQTQMRERWGFSELLPGACDGCNPENGGGLSTLFSYLPDAYPDVRFALIASNQDAILRLFYGYGNEECMPGGGVPDLGVDRFGEALWTLHEERLEGRVALFEVDSDVHTWSTKSNFYSAETSGVRMADWFQSVLDGPAETVRP